VERIITGDINLDLLEQFIPPKLETLKTENPADVFQRDSAPIHLSIQARLALNARFPNQWTGKGGSTVRPPRSPDLTPPDFLMWGAGEKH
jgi:hypothetical protein